MRENNVNNISVLDCTLREAPIENLMWGENSVSRIIQGLENALTDIIEVGFLKNNEYADGSTSFQNVEQIRPYLKTKKRGTDYVALIDYGRYDLSKLSPYDGTSIDGIRICFKKNEVNDVLKFAEKIKNKGYKVCIQHVDTLAYSKDEILKFIEHINRFRPYAYSIVDTFGAMYEDEMLNIAHMVDNNLDKKIRLGFHGHNNIMLADANAQCFIREISVKRNIIVDSSLLGCGRGAGNAHTELILQYINRKHGGSYDLNEALDVIDEEISKLQDKIKWGYSMPYFISGMHNSHTFNVKHLLKRHNIRSKDLRNIIEKLNEEEKKKYDYTLLERIYVEYFDKAINDTYAISQIRTSLQNRVVLLIAPGKSIISEYDKICDFIKEENPIIIAVNNIIEKFKFDYIFFSSIKRYQGILYNDYISAGSPQLIITSNIMKETSGGELIVDYKSLVKFGWINIDSSAILLLRLLINCEVKKIFIAGLDGYDSKNEFFYKKELDSGLENDDKIENTKENMEMLRDIIDENPNLKLHFLTRSIYESMGEKDV